ncbi:MULTISPECIES: helix-turn-helix domain-containing protein [unclassified Sphingomonas]|jgi:AraC-like DNA-binding protein|uniref:AraC family transcriptional regulator n=2 Tax=unclassified Sphingomonas TaxID=196159 RepID=UPI000A8B2879|nr:MULTISPECIES: helix-turn-helix domain-containing protein [unclassified Sphingomonas]
MVVAMWWEGLSFGWRSAVLTVAVAQLLILAIALAGTFENRIANRTLAALLVVLAATVTPWLIGFAGFYDKWRWLTFAPFQITLAVAPLLYFYVHALVFARWPDRGWRHFIPAGAQFAFLFGSFLLPIAAKDRWADASGGVYGVATDLGVVIGLGLYGRAALRLLRGYRAFLTEERSDDHRYAGRWLSRAIGGLLVLLAIWSGYNLWNWVSPLGYRGLMGLYVVIAAVALYLGIEGWRHADRPFPRLAPRPAAPAAPARDWRADGERWAAITRAQGWQADPDLSLAMLARRLGTNTGHLSRALNDGLGCNFSTFVNKLRCDAVTDAIRAGRADDLLDLAFEAGFRSKASFNRAFLAQHGMAPSAYRRLHGSKRE